MATATKRMKARGNAVSDPKLIFNFWPTYHLLFTNMLSYKAL